MLNSILILTPQQLKDVSTQSLVQPKLTIFLVLVICMTVCTHVVNSFFVKNICEYLVFVMEPY